MSPINWYRIIGNAGTAGVSTSISVLTSNGLGMSEIPSQSIIHLSIIMGILYALLALFQEMKKIGDSEKQRRKLVSLTDPYKHVRLDSNSLFLLF